MRYFVFVSFILFYFNSNGQNATENMNQLAFANPFHSSSQQYLAMANYKNRDLKEFLNYDWVSAEILGNSNEMVILDSVNYFFPEQKIIFFSDGQLMELYPDQVQKVRIGNEKYLPFIDKNNKKKALQFFEVLAGTEFKVLKITKVTEEAKSIHPMGIKSGESKLVKRFKYFFVRENTNIAIPIPGNKHKFLKTFKKHKKKLVLFLEKRGLSPRVENDLILIARYYNKLLSE
jgi:hypothetical protein